jgi:hypothetical protein
MFGSWSFLWLKTREKILVLEGTGVESFKGSLCRLGSQLENIFVAQFHYNSSNKVDWI